MRKRRQVGLRHAQDAPVVAMPRSSAVASASPVGAFCRGVSGCFRLYPVGLLAEASKALLIAPQILTDSA